MKWQTAVLAVVTTALGAALVLFTWLLLVAAASV